MGVELPQDRHDDQAQQQFTHHVLQDLKALAQMHQEGLIETGVARIGAEQELFLIDRHGWPAPCATEVLARMDDPHVTTELARFNLEINLDPLPFSGGCLREMEDDLLVRLAYVNEEAQALEAQAALVGILPTLRLADLSLERMTPLRRYALLNERLSHQRGAPYRFHIRGQDELYVQHDSVMLEACNTSFQVHLQVNPADFARWYNIAQVATGPVLAAAANAPLLFGKRLWEETRIALFQQAVDTRSGNLYFREARPRVMFGTGWVQRSVLEIYQEDVARFRSVTSPPLDEDPMAVLAAGGIPKLQALQIHNGTVYRWNRPCYGITEGRPHLRIENRVLPSGPTIADEVANAAFWLGLVRGLAYTYGDVTSLITFDAARTNFARAAREGLAAPMVWLDGQTWPAPQLITEVLVPLARVGLAQAGIDPEDIDHYLGIIAGRAANRQNGAEWLRTALDDLRGDEPPQRHLNTLVELMVRRQQSGQPVHTWTLPQPSEVVDQHPDCMLVGQCMSSDLITIQEADTLELAASLMDWRNVRHLPVEDDQQRLVGLVSVGGIAKAWAAFEEGGRTGGGLQPIRVAMIHAPLFVTPDTTMTEALALMRRRGFSALPVVHDDQLVGILTERDLVKMAARLMAPAPTSAVEALEREAYR